jgi:uncharacterized membrane protein YecN with MAPEG domain
VWILGYIYCKVNNYVSYLTVSLSVFTLLAISIDRRKVRNRKQKKICYIETPKSKAIVSPLAPKSGRYQVLLTILSIWLVSGVLASPALVYSQEVSIRR